MELIGPVPKAAAVKVAPEPLITVLIAEPPENTSCTAELLTNPPFTKLNSSAEPLIAVPLATPPDKTLSNAKLLMTVKRAMAYYQLMKAEGLMDPYRELTERPPNASRWTA